MAYTKRRHFFTDWAYTTPYNATDITSQLGGITVTKYLNRKDGGGIYISGLPVIERTLSYIPSSTITPAVINRIKDGDYIGTYAHDGGLDVTHVGIFLRVPHGPVIRNASSLKMNNKVVDSPFNEYIASLPGIIVLRPN